nr:phage portal protein [Microvirga thermotolerans]
MGDAFSPFTPAGSASSFEGAGYGRRLRNFSPSHAHVNAALQSAGRTLVKRARFLVENNAYAGNAVDVWAAWVIGDGICPRFPVQDPERRRKLKKLWNKWVKEADAECQTNFYGLQEKIVREAYISGECFVRLRTRRPGDMKTVPLQLQVMPSEMLDLTYNADLGGGNFIRMGIEFDAIGRRVAYHFWRNHPDDYRAKTLSGSERIRVPASEVLHIFDARQAGQIRGVSRFARAIVKIFSGDTYDDAEMERKKTAALYAGFVTQNGEQSPVDSDSDDDDAAPVPIEPGAMLALRDGEDVKFSSPADVGGSYEPFQYRTTLQVSVALGIPYAYLTGDTTKGNFSNVRTEIVNFRRKISQFQQNVIIPQGCEPVAERWLELAEATGLLKAGDDARDEDWLPPRMEWVDPRVDVETAIKEVRAGFATRGQVIASKGYDREDIDDERERENEEADSKGLIYDTDPRRVSSVGMSNAVPTGSGYLESESVEGDEARQ